MTELEQVQAAQSALMQLLQGHVAVGITPYEKGSYGLAVRIQQAIPDDLVIPTEFQGYHVDTKFVGPGFPQSAA